MKSAPFFSDTEQTAAQRSESVKWAVGVTLSQGQSISLELRDLYKQYVAGQVDLATIDEALAARYPDVPTTDPRYQPGQGLPERYYPPAVAAPSPAYQQLDMAQAWTLD